MAHLLEMKNICKSFSGVSVLKNNHLELEAGEVHALLGENGAGKSTLIKILGGVYTKDSGQILVDGQEVEITGVESAKEHGIRIIHQELMLIPDMTISENIFILKGELVYRYLDETNKEQSLKLKQGDLLSVDKDIHTFENQTDEIVEFIVFRYLPSYKNQSEMIKNDKEIIER
jgi:ABC-type sugar transport system ATPase subunit